METLAVDMPALEVESVLDRLQEIRDTTECIVQAVDARYVAGTAHLSRAMRMTRRAIDRETMIADDPAMEVLLFVAGTRQIERAIDIGIQPETTRVAVVIEGARETEAVERIVEMFDNPSGEIHGDNELIRDWFDITSTETRATTATLQELVCERVVLLQLEA